MTPLPLCPDGRAAWKAKGPAPSRPLVPPGVAVGPRGWGSFKPIEVYLLRTILLDKVVVGGMCLSVQLWLF
jgi:hypothetical protein